MKLVLLSESGLAGKADVVAAYPGGAATELRACHAVLANGLRRYTKNSALGFLFLYRGIYAPDVFLSCFRSIRGVTILYNQHSRLATMSPIIRRSQGNKNTARSRELFIRTSMSLHY